MELEIELADLSFLSIQYAQLILLIANIIHLDHTPSNFLLNLILNAQDSRQLLTRRTLQSKRLIPFQFSRLSEDGRGLVVFLSDLQLDEAAFF